MVTEDQDRDRTQDGDGDEAEAETEAETEAEGEAEESVEATQAPARRGWVRRSVASSGTHHSTELIEVQVPDHPAITMDCCVQVMHHQCCYSPR